MLGSILIGFIMILFLEKRSSVDYGNEKYDCLPEQEADMLLGVW